MFSHLISVIFMKERDVVLSNNQWRVAVNVNLSTYHEVFSTVNLDLLAEKQQRKEFTSVSEIRLNCLYKFWNINLRNFIRFYPDQILDEVYLI